MQQGVQTGATRNIQQSLGLLANIVEPVCIGLKVHNPFNSAGSFVVSWGR